MTSVKLILVLALSIALVLLVVQNSETVQARFLWFTAEMPVIMLLFLATVGGFVLGLLVMLLLQRYDTRPISKRGGRGK